MIRMKLNVLALALLPLLCVSGAAYAQEEAGEPSAKVAELQAAEDMKGEVDPAASEAAPASGEAAAAEGEIAPADGEAATAENAAPAADGSSASMPAEEQTVLRAQVLLDRAHFSSGEIDGRKGSNLKTALSGFQSSRGLDADGSLGPATWAELERNAVPTLVDYTILAADVAGPFEKLPADMMERAKLPALGYTSAEEALGERFHASPNLIKSLNPGKSLAAGEVIKVPNVVDAPSPAASTQIIVDRSDKTVLLADAEGNVTAQFPSSTGSEHDPLPVGDWKVNSVSVKPEFSYNPDLFWDANPAHSKAKLAPGPNNPVGMVWIDLSKEHYGIHGTPEPSRVGKSQSHGCIRLTNWSALLVSEIAKAGMPVVLRE